MTELDELKQTLTPRGQQVLEDTVDRKGEEWVLENKELILAQAELVGLTTEEPSDEPRVANDDGL